MKKRKARRKSLKPFGIGQANRLIDDLIHPLFQEDKNFIWVDGILHAAVEQNPRLSLEKFVKYNLPELLKTKKKRQRNS